MEAPAPEKEHAWLRQLVGSWRYKSQSPGHEGQPPRTVTGTETVRSIGHLWIIAETSGEEPGGAVGEMQFTLGYDPQRQRFVGCFVSSMMTHSFMIKSA